MMRAPSVLHMEEVRRPGALSRFRHATIVRCRLRVAISAFQPLSISASHLISVQVLCGAAACQEPQIGS